MYLEERMKRKLLILFAVLIGLCILLTSCKMGQDDPNKVLDFLKDLDAYSTDFVMETKNDKQTITQEGKQFYNKKQGYRLELGQDRVFIYKSDKIYVHDVKNNFKYTLDKDFDSGYKITFINEYINLLHTNEEIKYALKEIEGKKYQLIELIIPGGNEEISKAVMHVNIKTRCPEWIFVYDEKENERIKISYKSFQANPELNPDLYKTE
jgi:outer membrane lipoprotein-sorting protein